MGYFTTSYCIKRDLVIKETGFENNEAMTRHFCNFVKYSYLFSYLSQNRLFSHRIPLSFLLLVVALQCNTPDAIQLLKTT